MPDFSGQLGAKLAPRLADMISRAVVDVQSRMIPQQVKGSMQLQESFFRLVGSETKRTVGQLSRELAATPGIEPWLADTLGFMGNETGQWSALLNFAAYGSGLSGGLTGIITNEIAPLVEKRYAAQPNAVHSPQTLAALVATRKLTLEQGQKEAKKSALDTTRFEQLVYLGETIPDFGVMMEMRRRGLVSATEVSGMLRKQGYREQFIPLLAVLQRVKMSAPDLANLVDRGEVTEAQAVAEAEYVGVNDVDFKRMVSLVGVPPALELLLSAYRRGIIDKPRLDRGIRQSPLRSEWIDVISQLQYDPISTLQAADLASQNLITRDEGHSIAHVNGTKAADFDLLVEGAGRPPGIQEMLELWNRGEVTEAEVKQALLESPLKNKWVPVIMQTRRRIPPQDTVRMMVNKGVLTPAQGVKRFMAVGFDADDAAALADLAQKDKTQGDRDLTKAEVMSLYEYRLISETQARGMLDTLGYDGNEQGLLLSLSDFRRGKRELDAAASVVRAKYVAHKISDGECSMILDGLHVPADARDHLMRIWGLERDANQRDLTPAQVIAAVKDGFIARAEGMARLAAQGYDPGDANLLISHVLGAEGG